MMTLMLGQEGPPKKYMNTCTNGSARSLRELEVFLYLLLRAAVRNDYLCFACQMLHGKICVYQNSYYVYQPQTPTP